MSVRFLVRRLMAKLACGAVLVAACSAVAHADKIESTEFRYSEEQNSVAIIVEATRWKLSEQEYRRYLDIMKGPLNRWSPNIDPVLALGIFSDSESEQQRFAELYAIQEHDLTVRTLDFERVYRQAFARLFPSLDIIDDRLLEAFYQHQEQIKQSSTVAINRDLISTPPTLQEGDRLLYFPVISCRVCGQTLSTMLERLKTLNVVIDVYVKEASTEEGVRAWASSNGISIDWVHQGNVTLNMDRGLYERLQKKTATTSATPSLFLSRGDAVFNLDESVFQQ